MDLVLLGRGVTPLATSSPKRANWRAAYYSRRCQNNPRLNKYTIHGCPHWIRIWNKHETAGRMESNLFKILAAQKWGGSLAWPADMIPPELLAWLAIACLGTQDALKYLIDFNYLALPQPLMHSHQHTVAHKSEGLFKKKTLCWNTKRQKSQRAHQKVSKGNETSKTSRSDRTTTRQGKNGNIETQQER